MRAKPVLRAVASVAAMCICAGQSRAQVGTVSAVGVRADHDLHGATLFGGAAHVSIPIGNGGASIRLGAERVSGHARRMAWRCTTEDYPPLSRALDALVYHGRENPRLLAAPSVYASSAAHVAEIRRRIGILTQVYGGDFWTQELDDQLRSATGK